MMTPRSTAQSATRSSVESRKAPKCVPAVLGTITILQRIHEARVSIEATLDAPTKD